MSGQIDYVQKVFADVERRQDIVFRTAANVTGQREDLRLDVTFPAGDARPYRRAALWIHGGGFQPGHDKRQSYIVRMADEFALRGYVCFCCDYRVREMGMQDYAAAVTDAVEDCGSALAWIRTHAPEYSADGARILLGGGSAGGMTAVNLAARETTFGPSEGVPAIAALVNLWGTPPREGFLCEPTVAFPPTITVHGTADALVPYEQSVALGDTLRRLGVPNRLYTVQGGPHTPVPQLEEFSAEIARFVDNVWRAR